MRPQSLIPNRNVLDYGIAVLANAAILIAWALYDQMRFRRRDRGGGRRRSGDPVSVADLAALYGLRASDVEKWQESRTLIMQHDPDGTLTEVIAKKPGQTESTHLRRFVTKVIAPSVPAAG